MSSLPSIRSSMKHKHYGMNPYFTGQCHYLTCVVFPTNLLITKVLNLPDKIWYDTCDLELASVKSIPLNHRWSTTLLGWVLYDPAAMALRMVFFTWFEYVASSKNVHSPFLKPSTDYREIYITERISNVIIGTYPKWTSKRNIYASSII